MSVSVHAAVEKILDESLSNENAAGAAVGVVLEGKLIDSHCRGFANIEFRHDITVDTPFHLASVSKHFTAFAIAMLAVEGLVDLDADARDCLPMLPQGLGRITLRQMVHHTSGLRDQWDLLALAGWRIDDIVLTSDIVELVSHQEATNFEPGAAYSYSNTGYTLLGEAVKAVTGSSLREYCEKEIFAPLGMSSTHFHDSYSEIVPGRADSYGFENGVSTKALLNYGTVGATSLFSTVNDLVRWDQNFYDGKVGGRAVLDLMHEVGVLNNGAKTAYAFGLLVDRHRGARRVFHGGSDASFTSYLLRFPEERLSIIAISNTGELRAPLIGDKVADLMLDELGRAATSPSPSPAPASISLDLDSSIGFFVEEETGLALIIDSTGEALTADSGNGPEPLSPLGDGLFQVSRFSTLTLSTEDGRRQVTVKSRFGDTSIYKLADRVTSNETAFDEFVGNYWCSEVEAGATVEFEGESLVLKHRKRADAALTPTVVDSFNGFWGDPNLRNKFSLKFVWEDEKVVGFVHSFERSRNINYARISQ